MPTFPTDRHINDEGYSTRTQIVHCAHAAMVTGPLGADGKAGPPEAHADCALPLFDRYKDLNLHHRTVWEHFGKDDAGLLRVPHQTSIMYCLKHSPFVGKPPNTRDCVVCAKPVDRAQPRSEVDVAGLGHFRMHDTCAPAEFDVLKTRRKKIAEPAPSVLAMPDVVPVGTPSA